MFGYGGKNEGEVSERGPEKGRERSGEKRGPARMEAGHATLPARCCEEPEEMVVAGTLLPLLGAVMG